MWYPTYIVSFLFLYILLPLYLAVKTGHHSLKMLFLFFLACAIIIFYLLRRHALRKYRLEYRFQDLQEKSNVLSENNSREIKTNHALKAKIIRYHSLKKVVEDINKNLDPDSVADSLTSFAFSLITNNKGTCLLYLIDNQTQRLSLFKTKKEDNKLAIKAKEGNIFDFWVLRHSSPLLIEDIKKDFRFDLEKLTAQDIRPISSLISAPLISNGSLLGILKLDHHQPGFYSQDDLRLLVTLCDLGAVALENSQLFQKTQDLAIHDGLTALYTKGYFLEYLQGECRRNVHRGTSLSLLMIDIDFFKNYNDKFGHTAGDIVLKRLSRSITESLKDSNPFIARFGGEEFCVILHGLDKKKAYTIADALRQRIEKEKIILRRQETNVTVSIGLADFPADGMNADELILKSDRAMYEAKQKGRNRVCCI